MFDIHYSKEKSVILKLIKILTGAIKITNYHIGPSSVFFFFFGYLFSSVQLLSHDWLFVTPWVKACKDSLSITNSQSLVKLLSIELVMPSYHLILCHPFLLLPSTFPRIRVFSNESAFLIRWPSTGASATSVIPMNIQDWFPLGWIVWISLQSKGLSRVFSKATIFQKHQYFGTQVSLQSNSHIHIWLLEKP